MGNICFCCIANKVDFFVINKSHAFNLSYKWYRIPCMDWFENKWIELFETKMKLGYYFRAIVKLFNSWKAIIQNENCHRYTQFHSEIYISLRRIQDVCADVFVAQITLFLKFSAVLWM